MMCRFRGELTWLSAVLSMGIVTDDRVDWITLSEDSAKRVSIASCSVTQADGTTSLVS